MPACQEQWLVNQCYCRIMPACAIVGAMIKVLEDAIEKVKKLPKERQAHAAEILEQLVADADAGEFTIPEEHMEGVLQGLQQARSGELASEEEMAGLWKKWGL